MIVVADTSPINYLILIEEIELLPKLFGRIIIPPAVTAELQNPGTPESVRKWLASSPEWLKIQTPAAVDQSIALGAGERETISLAKEINASLILMDDRKARKMAIDRGLNVAGTLNILQSSAKRGFIELGEAVQKLEQTNFRVSSHLLLKLMK
jgi:predicted nucleic acid-binding protein